MLKSMVETKPETWRAFKALAAERGESVQRLLGKLVERELRAAERSRAQRLARAKVTQREIARLEAEIAKPPTRQRT